MSWSTRLLVVELPQDMFLLPVCLSLSSCLSLCLYLFITPRTQRERGKVIGVCVHIYIGRFTCL